MSAAVRFRKDTASYCKTISRLLLGCRIDARLLHLCNLFLLFLNPLLLAELVVFKLILKVLQLDVGIVADDTVLLMLDCVHLYFTIDFLLKGLTAFY